MAVLDEAHLVAQIVSRGNMLAQYEMLSISPYGPDQQESDLLGCVSLPPPSSLVLDSGASCMTDLADGRVSASASVSCSPTYSAVRSACSSPMFSWAAAAAQMSSPAAAQEDTSPAARPTKPAAQRSLSAALSIRFPAAPAAAQAQASPTAAEVGSDGEECSTPRAHMISAVLPPPGAPRAPRPTARLLVPTGGRRKLQQWLANMELGLTVPASPAAPGGMQDCPAPKVGTPRTSHRPAAPQVYPAGRLSTPSSSISGERTRSSPSFAAQLSSSSSSSSTGCRKRALPALALLPGRPSTAAAGDGIGTSAAPFLSAPCDAADTCVRSSKRRSPDGASSRAAAAAAAAASETSSSACGSTCGAADCLPTPAFDILGLLSGP